MADTKISWTDKVWNVTRGCRRVSPGCGGSNGEGGCYAERMAYRFSGPGQAYEGLVKLTANGPRWTGVGRFVAEKLREPLTWCTPCRVFVDSMSDAFFDAFTNEEIAAIVGVIAAAWWNTFQLLTKRPGRMLEWFGWVVAAAAADGMTPTAFCFALAQARGLGELSREAVARARTTPWPLPNLWMGVSVENRDALDRIDYLRQCPAVVRMISFEPLLEDLGDVDFTGLGWAIAGCESGPGARHCDVAWLRSLRDQCAAAGVPYFVKQATEAGYRLGGVGEYVVWAVVEGPGSKRKAGGVIELPYLDGVQHAAFPETR